MSVSRAPALQLRRRVPLTRVRAAWSFRPRRCGRLRHACARSRRRWPPERRTIRCACDARPTCSVRTGRKVPAPTCRVISARPTPRRCSAASSASSKCSAAVGCRNRARPACKHGLVAPLVVGVVRMRDVGRQRHMAMALEQRQRIGAEAQAVQTVVGAAAADHLHIESGAAAVRVAAAARPRRFAGTQWASTSFVSGSSRSTSTSTAPPLSLPPCRRALITRVSLKTSRSPGSQQQWQLGENGGAGGIVRQAVGSGCAAAPDAGRSAPPAVRNRSRRGCAVQAGACAADCSMASMSGLRPVETWIAVGIGANNVLVSRGARDYDPFSPPPTFAPALVPFGRSLSRRLAMDGMNHGYKVAATYFLKKNVLTCNPSIQSSSMDPRELLAGIQAFDIRPLAYPNAAELEVLHGSGPGRAHRRARAGEWEDSPRHRLHRRCDRSQAHRRRWASSGALLPRKS